MGAMHRRRKGLVAVLAIAVGGMFAPSALATTPLTASKTATAHWTRTFTWTIDKSVDKPAIELMTGSSATAKYTVAVTKSTGTDAMFVDGEICVTNSGTVPTEGLTIVDRLRVFLQGGSQTLISSTIDVSGNPVLDPGESHCYAYSFPFGPFPNAISYANEARITITNDAREPGVPLGPSVEAAFEVPASPTLVNDSVNVDDTNGMSWAFSASGSQTYNRTFTCDRDKGTHTNTATIRQTGVSDGAAVMVTCKPKPECPKGDKDKGKGKHKGKDNDGWWSWWNWYRDDRHSYHGYRMSGRDDDSSDDDDNRCGDSDDSSDDSSHDSSDDSSDD